MDLEQHFLNLKDNKLEKIILDKISTLQIETIIELGAGKGDFTKTFINSGIRINAYEIDKSLEDEFYINIGNGNATLFIHDISKIVYMDSNDIIISAPPYKLLPFINDKYIKEKEMRYILMVSERCLKLFKDAEIIYTLFPDNFIPESKGKHFIITNI